MTNNDMYEEKCKRVSPIHVYIVTLILDPNMKISDPLLMPYKIQQQALHFLQLTSLFFLIIYHDTPVSTW
jgi:hypothetical protein